MNREYEVGDIVQFKYWVNGWIFIGRIFRKEKNYERENEYVYGLEPIGVNRYFSTTAYSTDIIKKVNHLKIFI